MRVQHRLRPVNHVTTVVHRHVTIPLFSGGRVHRATQHTWEHTAGCRAARPNPSPTATEPIHGTAGTYLVSDPQTGRVTQWSRLAIARDLPVTHDRYTLDAYGDRFVQPMIRLGPTRLFHFWTEQMP
ncbi:hypothetical protein Sar04_25950 [Salinispora arenicola]|uniref:Uncharacterized protein n=1 Tax=Salinispora arenicola TaxID=168697 RepID=A0ABQ4JUW9_SALAC|nr:hypothetical protein Sar04_25950 [Salinispora arenicola]